MLDIKINDKKIFSIYDNSKSLFKNKNNLN